MHTTDENPFFCPHDHDFLPDSHDANARRTWFVILLTVSTMVLEIVSGLVFGSMALLADGWHMASHASAMGITAMAYYLIKKHRGNPRFTFGTGKINYLAAYSSAMLLAFIALFMAYESVQRLLDPQPIRYTEAMIVAVIGLVVNVTCALILKENPGHRHDHHHTGDHDHAHDHAHDHDPDHDREYDQNLRAAYFHVLADALTSILAIVALFFGKTFQWGFLDPVMGIVGAAVISRWSWGLMKSGGMVLLDHNPDTSLMETVRDTLVSAGAASVDDLHIWRLSQGRYGALASVTAPAGIVPGTFKSALSRISTLSHVTVEINPKPSAPSHPETGPFLLKPVGVIRSQISEPDLKADENGLSAEQQRHRAVERRRKIQDLISEIVIDQDLSEILDGIEGFSHILVLYWPHLIAPERRRLRKVHPMGRKDIPKKGIFATCSPARPNPVLITAVPLVERRGNILRVRGFEAVDGSPVLDIKPYNPGYYRVNDPVIPDWMQQLQEN